MADKKKGVELSDTIIPAGKGSFNHGGKTYSEGERVPVDFDTERFATKKERRTQPPPTPVRPGEPARDEEVSPLGQRSARSVRSAKEDAAEAGAEGKGAEGRTPTSARRSKTRPPRG